MSLSTAEVIQQALCFSDMLPHSGFKPTVATAIQLYAKLIDYVATEALFVMAD